MTDLVALLREATAEIERLRALVAELEAALAMAHGTLPRVNERAQEPFTVTHNVPGNAPA